MGVGHGSPQFCSLPMHVGPISEGSLHPAGLRLASVHGTRQPLLGRARAPPPPGHLPRCPSVPFLPRSTPCFPRPVPECSLVPLPSCPPSLWSPSTHASPGTLPWCLTPPGCQQPPSGHCPLREGAPSHPSPAWATGPDPGDLAATPPHSAMLWGGSVHAVPSLKLVSCGFLVGNPCGKAIPSLLGLSLLPSQPLSPGMGWGLAWASAAGHRLRGSRQHREQPQGVCGWGLHTGLGSSAQP